MPFKFGVDSSGNYGYIKAGADSVTPFRTGNATTAQVLSGYTFANSTYPNLTGTMVNNGGTSIAATYSLDSTNSIVVATIPTNGYYNTSSKLYATYSTVRSLIGLTAAKIVKGNTILGLAGTAVKSPTSLSGTHSAGKWAWGKVVEGQVNFSTAFASKPTLQATATGGSHGVDYLNTVVSKTGFTYEFEVAGTPDAGYSTITITWAASL